MRKTKGNKFLLLQQGVTHDPNYVREKNDYYATNPFGMVKLLEEEQFQHKILEGSCGEGHLSEVLKRVGYKVKSSDLIDRGYGEIRDFFDYKNWDGDIITNPPFNLAQEFIEHSMIITKKGAKIAMLLKTQYGTAIKRDELFSKYPLYKKVEFGFPMSCSKSGDFQNNKGGLLHYAWFIWKNGHKGYTELVRLTKR